MPILTAEALEKSFGVHVVLDKVDLSLHDGERVGLVGANGAGKSTLAKILAGSEPPDAGTLARRRDAEVAYLDQEPRLDESLTPREAARAGLREWSDAKDRYDSLSAKLAAGADDAAVLLAEQERAAADVERLGGWERMHTVDAMLGHLGISDPEQKLGTLSGGERRRVALAKILVSQPALAILDEPTNHLDVETVDWLEQYLLDEYRGALLLVTHDRYLLERVCTRTLEIDRGKVYSYAGGYELYLEQKAERLAHESRTEQNRQNLLRREIEWLRRQPKARTTKQKARIDRAEAALAVKAPTAEKTAALELEEKRSGKTILELRGVSLDRGGRRLVRALDLYLTQGERVGVVGKNGTGKSTLLAALVGEIDPAEGQVVVGQNTTIAYFDQQRSGLRDDQSILDNVAGDRTTITLGGEVLDPRVYLERFLFDRHKQRQEVGSLSGGERARVALAKLLRQSANLVLLDEPTNDLDVGTLAALEAMLVDFGGTSFVVTHDRYFLDRIATSILAFEGDGRVVRYGGNYEAYRRAKEAAAAAAAAEEDAKRGGAQGKGRGSGGDARGREARGTESKFEGKRGLTYAEKKELEGILDEVEAADREVALLEAKLADPATYAGGGDEVKGLHAQLEAARARAAERMTRWEALEEKRAAGEGNA